MRSFHLVDGLRCLAALAVVLFHYKDFFANPFTAGLPDGAFRSMAAFEFFAPVMTHGYLAVMLFWAISGFVFAHCYGDRRGSISARSYAVRRFARLYPLHLATLIYIVVMQAASTAVLGEQVMYPADEPSRFVLHLFMASHWVPDAPLTFNGPFWSVSVEVLIYAYFLLHVMAFPFRIAPILAALAGFAVLYRLSGHDAALCGTYFFAGCLGYWGFAFLGRLPGALRIAGTAACAAGGAGILAVGGAVPGLPTTLLGAPFVALLLCALGTVERAFAPDRFRALGRFGDITYSSYLLHTPMQMTILVTGGLGLFDATLLLTHGFVAGYLVVLVALSLLCYRHFEAPAQRFIRARLDPAPSRPVGSAAVAPAA